MEDKEKLVYDILEKLEINYEKRAHPPVYTSEEANKYTSDLKGIHCKNLFLRNGKGNKHYLVVIKENKKLNINDFEKNINEKNIGFASEKRMIKYLGLTPGSVSIFGLINDKENEVIVYLDYDIFKEEYVNFHPNINTSTLNFSANDLSKFLKWCGNKINIISIS